MSELVTLTIDGMHCGACVRRVRVALEKVVGVGVSDVSIGKASVTLTGAALTDVLAALDQAGYPARQLV